MSYPNPGRSVPNCARMMDGILREGWVNTRRGSASAASIRASPSHVRLPLSSGRKRTRYARRLREVSSSASSKMYCFCFRLIVDCVVTKTLDQIAAPGSGKFRVRGQVLSRRTSLCPDESPSRLYGSDSPTRGNLEVVCAFSHHQRDDVCHFTH